MGKIFQKAFRILEFDERKGRWAVGQDFHGNFQVNVTWFVAFFLWCSWLDCAHSGMVWKISSLCTSYWTKLALTIKTDDVTRSRRDVDLPSSYGQLNGEWVKQRDFSATHINEKWVPFPFSCHNASKFVLLSVFNFTKTIWLKILGKMIAQERKHSTSGQWVSLKNIFA